MPSKYYSPGEDRARQVDDLFASIAPHYDRINDLQSLGMHRWWKRRLVRMAAIRPTDDALDLCCGTGDVAFGLAVRGARVVGLDASAAMLEQARRRQDAISDPLRLTFKRGDALDLPFEARTFDVVTVAYGLRNVADIDRGLLEMARVLRPAGRLLILEFGKPRHPLWRWLYFRYLQWVVPLLGRWIGRDAEAYRYILDSLLAYPAQEGIRKRLLDLGFMDVRCTDLLGGVMSIHVAHWPAGDPAGVKS